MSFEEFQLIQKALDKEKKIRIVIISGSMLPVIPVGQKLEVEPVQFEELKRFDPVVFWSPDGKLMCHCVWHVNQTMGVDDQRVIVTRGIQNQGTDLPVRESEILGRVVGVTIPWWIKVRFLFRKVH